MFYALLWCVVTALGGVLGWATGWLASRRDGCRPGRIEIDPETEAVIQAAADRWATSRGRPWLAPLIADKLRMAYRLRQPGPWS
jgi:hypothetical protein